MSTYKKLFSKRDKADKSTSTGKEKENSTGVFGVPKNNKNLTNSKNINKKEITEKFDNQDQKIDKITNTFIKNTENNKNLKNKTNALEKKIKDLKESLEKERKEFIEDINNHDNEYNLKNEEIKKLSNNFINKIEALKNLKQNIKLNKKIKIKSKPKTEEDIKKDIKLIETRIQNYENRNKIDKEDYNISLKNARIKEKKENNLEEELKGLNERINALDKIVKELRIMKREHLNCNENIQKMVEDYKIINKIFQNEIKRAKQLTLKEISENKEYNNKNVEKDNEEKAINDEKKLLPKIQTINFSDEIDAALEAKIIKKNKIGLMQNSQSNKVLILYNKLSKEFEDEKRYIKEGNRNIHINNSKSYLKTEDNYLFKDSESNLLQKLLPENLINSYQSKFNTILTERNNIRRKLFIECYNMKNENILKANEKDFNNLKLKELNQKNVFLNNKYIKLKGKINDIKRKIKEVENQIKIENNIITNKEKEKKRIEIYYKGFKKNTK